MSDTVKIILTVSVAVVIFAVLFIAMRFWTKNSKIDARFIGRTAIFAAISTILYVVPIFQFNVPFFPFFLTIHFDEVAAAIAGFAYGPLSGFAILLIKTLIKLPMTTSVCIGEVADLIYGAFLILPGAFMYRKWRNFKGVAIGLSIGFAVQVVVAAFFTTFVLVPLYSKLYMPLEDIINACNKVNPNISLDPVEFSWDFFLWVGLPFNAFKNVIIIALTLVLYKLMHRLIDMIAFRTIQESKQHKAELLAQKAIKGSSNNVEQAIKNKEESDSKNN